MRQTIPDPPRPKQLRTMTRSMGARRFVPGLEPLRLRTERRRESVLPISPMSSIREAVVDERAPTSP
jgi:hypothetical protein